MKGVTKEWALTLGFSVLTVLVLGLGLTWVNIERVDMAYELKRLQTEIDSQEALLSKLEVERNTLLTPDRLRTLAAQYGLTQARPGQIRRLSAGGEEMPSPVLKACPVPDKAQKKADAAAKAKAAAPSATNAIDAGAEGVSVERIAPKAAKTVKDGKAAAASGKVAVKSVKAVKAAAGADTPAASGGKRTPVPYDGAGSQDRARTAPADGTAPGGAGKAAI
jgi:cell division protein FtsL